MSEAMGLEALAANVLGSKLNTPLTKTRFRLYGADGGYTDLDAVAAAPMNGQLAIAECKAQSGPRHVYQINDEEGMIDGGYTGSLLKAARAPFLADNRWTSPYLQYGSQEEPWSGLRELHLWLFANVFVAPEVAEAVDNRLTQEILAAGIDGLPEGVVVTAHVRSTLDLVLDGFQTVERWVVDIGWGVRSGDPVLDILREVVRYKHACVTQGGHGASAVARAHYQDLVRRILLDE